MVMPNHIHGILILNNKRFVETLHARLYNAQKKRPTFVRRFYLYINPIERPWTVDSRLWTLD